MTLVELAYLAMSVVLALAGLVIAYPAVAGVQVVVYRRAVLALSAGLLLFVASWLVIFLYAIGVASEYTVTILSLGGNTVAGVLHFVAVWLFARDFVVFDAGSIEISATSSTTGGFQDERE